MATITSAGSGNWGTGATWVGGSAPADNDTVVIANGHSVIYNVDTSAWANGIAGITVTGTLSVNTAASSYMKLKAATTISGAGTFNVGTSGTPIPFAVKFTLTGGSGWYVQGSGGLTMGVYGAEPTYTYAKLSGAESAGATRLEIDTDLTGDIWANTDSIRINNVAQAQQTELRVISAITSTYIDITAGLTSAKIAGSYICLVTRNVTITGLGTSVLVSFQTGKLTIGGGSLTSDNKFCIESGVSVSISGGVFSGHGRVMYNCSGSNTITEGVLMGSSTACFSSSSGINISGGLFSGNANVFYYSFNAVISSGIFSGNTQTFFYSYGVTVSGGVFSGNTTVFYTTTSVAISGGQFLSNTVAIRETPSTITNATFTSNTYDIRESQFTALNQSLTSTVENYLYANLSRNTYSESIDHDQSAGAFKSWTRGGVTTSVATPVPTGFTRSYQLAPEKATVEGFFNRRVNVPAGKTINLTLYLRKNASMTYLPRVWVHKLGTEPFTTAGDILHTFTMTNSTDTWETDTYSYTNTADYDIELNCRFVAMNADGYVYGQMLDSLGGGISKSRIIGGV